jgi:hypothetical protein
MPVACHNCDPLGRLSPDFQIKVAPSRVRVEVPLGV